MKFSEASARLDKLADGHYHAIRYELMTHESGRMETQCNLYIEGPGHFFANTFDACFVALEQKIEQLADVEG